MKLRATVLLFAACCLLAASPIWASSICDGVAGNLVTNCGFETGDFTGWTLSGNIDGFTGVDGNPNSGNSAAFSGPVGSDGFVTQNVGNNSTSYFLSFYLFSEGGDPNNFTVYWNGVDIGPDLVDSDFFTYTQFSKHLVGNSGAGSNQLTFAFRQDPAFWWLDDVVVTGTPEPGTLMLLGTGLIGAIGAFRRKINL